MQKVKSWRVFDAKKKGNLLFKKSKKVKEKKNEFKKKEIMKIKGQTKKRMQKEVNAKRDEQNMKWWKKDGRKTCNKEKHKKFERDSFFKYGRVLEKKRKDKKETKLTLQKSREKGRSLHEENCMILSDCKGQGQNIFKEKSRTWEEEFFKEMEGKSEKAGTDIFSEDVTKKKKVKEKR